MPGPSISVSTPFRERIHVVCALLGGIAMMIAWLIPNHYPPWLSYYNEVGIAISSVLLLAAAYARGGPVPGVPNMVWFVVALAVIPWIQFWFGLLDFSGDAWVSCLYAFSFASTILIGHQWGSSKEADLPKILSTATLFAACVSTVLGLIQTFFGAVLGIWSVDGRVGMQASANLGQPNNLGLLIAFGSIGLIYLRERNLLGRVAAICLLAVLVVGAASTRSRTTLLFGPTIALYVAFIAKYRPNALKLRPSTVFFAAAVHWALAYAWPLFQQIEGQLAPLASNLQARGLETNRLQIWQVLLSAVNEHPWTGFGWLQVGAAQYSSASNFPSVNELYLHGHNLVVELIVWCGYPLGVGLVIAIAYWCLNRAFRVSTPEAVCGMIFVSVLGVHSMLELPYQYAYFLIPVGLWIGIVERSIGSRAPVPGFWRLPCFGAALLLLVALTKDYASVEADFRILRYSQAGIGTGPTPTVDYTAPFHSAITSYIRASRVAVNAQMSGGDLELLRKVTRRFPYGNNIYRHSLALAVLGRIDEARDVFANIRHIFGEPAYRSYYFQLRELAAKGHPEIDALLTVLPPPSGEAFRVGESSQAP